MIPLVLVDRISAIFANTHLAPALCQAEVHLRRKPGNKDNPSVRYARFRSSTLQFDNTDNFAVLSKRQGGGYPKQKRNHNDKALHKN